MEKPVSSVKILQSDSILHIIIKFPKIKSQQNHYFSRVTSRHYTQAGG